MLTQFDLAKFIVDSAIYWAMADPVFRSEIKNRLLLSNLNVTEEMIERAFVTIAPNLSFDNTEGTFAGSKSVNTISDISYYNPSDWGDEDD